jgi:catechol 2,3-dioxygenase-like lactoylglutathione lyase family enzyme
MTDERPVLDQLNLVVRDMEASVAFYRRLGLEIADGDPAWAGAHRNAGMSGGLDLDLDSRAFARTWDGGRSESSGSVVIGFRLASREAVDRLYSELTEAGYRGSQPPFDAFWGARYAIVEDPDGNPVGLMSPADPGRRTAPPAPPSE